MTRVLVTGSSGFIGSHLVARLQARGDEVLAWDCYTLNSFGRTYDSNYDLVVCGRARLDKAVSRADRVFHLAGNADVSAYNFQKDLMAREWVAAATVIGACQEHQKPLVVASAAYADGCNTLYGHTKRGIEEMCALASAMDGCSPVGVARIFNVYGPGQERAVTYKSTVVLNLYRAFKKGNWSLKHPSAWRNFVFIDDVIRQLLWVMEKTAVEGWSFQWDLASEEATTIFTLGNLMARLMGHTGVLEVPAAEEREAMPYDPAHGLARPDIDLEVSLEEGLRRTIASLEEMA